MFLLLIVSCKSIWKGEGREGQTGTQAPSKSTRTASMRQEKKRMLTGLSPMLDQRILRISLRKLNLLLMREVQVIQAQDQCVQVVLLSHFLSHIGDKRRFAAALYTIEAYEHGCTFVLEAVDEVLLVGFEEERDDM